MKPTYQLLALSVFLLTPLLAHSQSSRKLYCWNQENIRVCSDTLPPSALGNERVTLTNNGRQLDKIGRALTPEELATKQLEDAQRRADEAAAETRRLTDQAMLINYPNEDALRRVFVERTKMMDGNIQLAKDNVHSLRGSLVTLLQFARDIELSGQAADKKVVNNITSWHAELMNQQRIKKSFEEQRVALDSEIDETLQRYRQLKAANNNTEETVPAPVATL